jgi:uncharacterized protein (DUF1501 family)
MAITRRQFLQRGAIAAAAATSPHPLMRAMLGARTAEAAPPAGAILVLIQLQGGNDGLNMVIPVDDAGPVAQRTLYEAARPNLGVPVANLLATEIDADPMTGTRLALHPAMTELKGLYDAGLVAVVNGVGYPGQSLSHFRSEDIWFSADPTVPFASGWFGRYLDGAYSASDLVAVDVNETLNPIFVCQDCNVLAVRRLSDFRLPDDPLYPDLTAKKAALDAMFAVEANPLQTAGLQRTIGTSGDTLLSKIDDYAAINTSWAAHLDGVSSELAKRLKQIASVIRYDTLNPSLSVGARFFHVRLGGFDTHTQQGTLTGSQPTLLQRLSQAVKAFHDDLGDIGAADKTLMVTFSEFGRRVAENGSTGVTGTDHGAAAPLFVIGNPVAGGVYGMLPALNDLSSGNLKFNVDFRRVYATVIDDWLATPGVHTALLPGAPYTTLPFIA